MKRILLAVTIGFAFNTVLAQVKHEPGKNIIFTQKVYMHYREQRDSLTLPVADDDYPQLKEALSPKNLLDEGGLDSIIKRYETDGTGITSFDYKVTYADNHVISIKLFYETMGAHPDNYSSYLTLDIHTGKPYQLSNELNPNGLLWVFHHYKHWVGTQIIEEKKDNQKHHGQAEDAGIYDELSQSLKDLTINDLLANYIFTDKGIIFTTQAQFARVVRAMEPDRDLFVPYSRLKAFRNPKAIILK